MTTIYIEKENLIANDYDNGKTYTITGENGSGLYSTQEGEFLTRDELKKMCDIDKLDETLEMLANANAGRIYTEDELNFIDEAEYNALKDEWKVDYSKIEFIIKEA